MFRKIKNRILFLLILVLLLNITKTVNSQTKHTYAIGSNYYYLTVTQNDSIEIKLGNCAGYVKGNYEIIGDTLKFISFNYIPNKLGIYDRELELIPERFISCLIIDTLLIPQYLFDFNFKKQKRTSIDSNLIEKFVLSDYKYFHVLKLKKDSIFTYSSGTDGGRVTVTGKWFMKGNYVILNHNFDSEIRPWFYEVDRLVIYDKFMIAKVPEENAFYYFIKR